MKGNKLHIHIKFRMKENKRKHARDNTIFLKIVHKLKDKQQNKFFDIGVSKFSCVIRELYVYLSSFWSLQCIAVKYPGKAHRSRILLFSDTSIRLRFCRKNGHRRKDPLISRLYWNPISSQLEKTPRKRFW